MGRQSRTLREEDDIYRCRSGGSMTEGSTVCVGSQSGVGSVGLRRAWD